MTLRTVRDGPRVFRFQADVLAAASSHRPGVLRWSEIVIYRLADGQYVISKVGRSVVAHRPECHRVYPDMPTWLEAGEEAQVHRTGCLECQPEVGNRMDPQTVLEAQRYTVLRARSPEELQAVLVGRREGQFPRLIRDVLAQVEAKDSAFTEWSTARQFVHMNQEDTGS